jgi:hypothetical protein
MLVLFRIEQVMEKIRLDLPSANCSKNIPSLARSLSELKILRNCGRPGIKAEAATKRQLGTRAKGGSHLVCMLGGSDIAVHDKNQRSGRG